MSPEFERMWDAALAREEPGSYEYHRLMLGRVAANMVSDCGAENLLPILEEMLEATNHTIKRMRELRGGTH